ncbi:MAG TPA: DUF948 domain-containing protein [Chlamydiales bacterium]|nr:DUF948 domain-containing protein [Chlamydiales bacterium]
MAFVVLVIVLIHTLIKARETLESVQQLTKKLDALADDLKSKSESLNVLFRPLRSLTHSRKTANDTVKEVVELVNVSLVLFDKIKAAVKHYAK